MTIIPCTVLTIGSWRRIATIAGNHDLVAYVCDVKEYITWFIRSAGFGFKMEIPFKNIVTTTFTNTAPGSGVASFHLSEPPIFYLKNVNSPDADGSSDHYWKQCSDWTEAHQATTVLHHKLKGSAVQLLYILQSLPTNKGAEIRLRYPSYHVEPPSPIKLPLPRMVGPIRPQYHDQLHVTEPHYTQAPLPPPDPTSLSDSDRCSLHSDPAVSHPKIPMVPDFNTPVYNEDVAKLHIRHGGGLYSEDLSDYTGVPISHCLAPRPYVAQKMPRSYLL